MFLISKLTLPKTAMIFQLEQRVNYFNNIKMNFIHYLYTAITRRPGPRENYGSSAVYVIDYFVNCDKGKQVNNLLVFIKKQSLN